MFDISNTSGQSGYGETSGEDRDSTEAFARKRYYQNLIKKAESVPMVRLFKYYNLKLDEYNKKVICPFSSHKGGREGSASFYFYPQTNSFWCFGCKIGTRACDFVAEMDGISRSKAAFKILKLFNDDVDEDFVSSNRDDFSEKLEIMLNFSSLIREFRSSNQDINSSAFIEGICKAYDSINTKHNLTNIALSSVVNQLKDKVQLYKR